MRTAAFPRNGESLGLASFRNTLARPAESIRMRRLSGPRGSAARQDARSAADSDTASVEGDYAPWAASQKAGKGKKEEGGEDHSKTWGSRWKEEGRTTTGFNGKTGEHNRRYSCKS